MSNTRSAQEIIQFIANAEKKTTVKVTFSGELAATVPQSVIQLGNVLFGDWAVIAPLLTKLTENQDYVVEQDGRNSAVPLLDKRDINARIEPGAVIRDQVTIGDNAVIMMGAVINIGAEIGAGTMIDMGAILGGRATVGTNSHIGAGAVLAGVIEPASAEPPCPTGILRDDEQCRIPERNPDHRQRPEAGRHGDGARRPHRV